MSSDLSREPGQYVIRAAAFIAIWGQFAAKGLCDGLGSAEYLRVSTLWANEGMPVGIPAFIRRHANLAPGSGEDTP